jgi:hypothetical protein
VDDSVTLLGVSTVGNGSDQCPKLPRRLDVVSPQFVAFLLDSGSQQFRASAMRVLVCRIAGSSVPQTSSLGTRFQSSVATNPSAFVSGQGTSCTVGGFGKGKDGDIWLASANSVVVSFNTKSRLWTWCV